MTINNLLKALLDVERVVMKCEQEKGGKFFICVGNVYLSKHYKQAENDNLYISKKLRERIERLLLKTQIKPIGMN